MNNGDVYESNNCGAFEVVKYINCSNVVVQFIDTGFVCATQASHIRRGVVKDYLSPSVFGVGYVGKGKYKASNKGKDTKPYQVWTSMIERCYCSKSQEKHPTYIGVTVCPEWHDFQVFAEWFDENYIKGYHLDKDIKLKGNKIYSPEACLFVNQADNIIEAHAKYYTFTSPQGKTVNIYNMSEFCRDNNLHSGHMGTVHSGKEIQHKGWTKYA